LVFFPSHYVSVIVKFKDELDGVNRGQVAGKT
jgi:hypothetical protein